jgi:predicted ATP-dependent serine protease
MSSFVKKINTTPQLYKGKQGVKQGCNGQYVVSSGNAGLDEVLGGGLVLGSLVLQFEDSIS